MSARRLLVSSLSPVDLFQFYRTNKSTEYVPHDDSSDSEEYDAPDMDDISEPEDLDKLVD